MTKIQLSSGASSSTTHHFMQSSQTVDRRSVIRPSNLAIEEAAHTAHGQFAEASSSRPSRLVNLRVHAADLIQAQAQEDSTSATIVTQPSEQQPIVPSVIELGTIDRSQAADLPPVDLHKMVPKEAPVEDEPVSFVPVVANQSVVVSESNPQDLTMSIAADYAAASIDATENSDGSIDAIAQATSEAITAIRAATDPQEIAEQVASLKAFADNLKTSSDAPEILELSNTIDKFINVAMKSTKVQEEVQKKLKQKAKEAIKPVTKKTPTSSVAITTHKSAPKAVARTASKQAARTAVRRTAARTTKSAPKLVADEDRALRTALHNVAVMDKEAEPRPSKQPIAKKRGAGKRFVLAFFCAVACVAAVVYFVGSNIPDISVKVAAIQTGIEASYPSYVPRDYSLSDINSENGKITMTFKGPEKSGFTLTEEKSSWDSTALLRNYVEPTWQSNYITTHEQGITIYISGANAAWVNGGVLYRITDSSNSLTKKQLRNIVTSM